MTFLLIFDGKYVIIVENWTGTLKEDNANTKKRKKRQRKAARAEPKQTTLQHPILRLHTWRIQQIVLQNGRGKAAVSLCLTWLVMIQMTTVTT